MEGLRLDKIYNIYTDMLNFVNMSVLDNDWFHPSGTRCKKIRKSPKYFKKKCK